MLVILFAALSLLLLAAVLLQTLRLRALQQKMEALRQAAEAELLKRDALWHDFIHDLRTPAANVFTLAELIQSNRDSDPEQLPYFLDEIHTASAQVLNLLAEHTPPRPDVNAAFGTYAIHGPAPSSADSTRT